MYEYVGTLIQYLRYSLFAFARFRALLLYCIEPGDRGGGGGMEPLSHR